MAFGWKLAKCSTCKKVKKTLKCGYCHRRVCARCKIIHAKIGCDVGPGYSG